LAITYIKLDRSSAAASERDELLVAIRDLRSVHERLDRIRDKMNNNFDDSGGGGTINWSTLQTLWGIPTNGNDIGVNANGARVFNYINGTIGAIEGTMQNADGKSLPENVG
jgi:hypothetical protein